MKTRPIPVLLAMLHHALACAYGLSRLPDALGNGSFGAGQVVGLMLGAAALILLVAKPNAGRWLSVFIFAIGALYCGLMLSIFLLQGGLIASAWKIVAFAAFFVTVGYLLAFGGSTRCYVAAART